MKRLKESNVLVVGCGGIGCELLKLLPNYSCSRITLVDEDTVDPTNLNRQFFFTLEDVNRNKAETAAEKLRKIGSLTVFSPINSSIMNLKDLNFYKQFDVVFNCLDNNEARIFVNQRCVLAGIMMIDGGSGGWLGQSFCATNRTARPRECFRCIPIRNEEVYPVCTIRQQPKHFRHCLVWAREIVENPEQICNHDVDTSYFRLDQSGSKNRKAELIYSLACKRATKFGIEPMSMVDSETFLGKIIPSICTTNSIVASLMILSFHKKKNYFLVQSTSKIIEAALNERDIKCIACSVPIFVCKFSFGTLSDFLIKFGGQTLITEDNIYYSDSPTSLSVFNGEYATVQKHNLIYGIYFEKSNNPECPELEISRLR